MIQTTTALVHNFVPLVLPLNYTIGVSLHRRSHYCRRCNCPFAPTPCFAILATHFFSASGPIEAARTYVTTRIHTHYTHTRLTNTHTTRQRHDNTLFVHCFSSFLFFLSFFSSLSFHFTLFLPYTHHHCTPCLLQHPIASLTHTHTS